MNYPHWSLKPIVKPAVEVLLAADLKPHVRVDISDDDAALTTYLRAARQYIERVTGRTFITTKYRYRLAAFPWKKSEGVGVYERNGAIKLPKAPVSSVTLFKYLDSVGVEKTKVLDTDYRLDLESIPALVTPPKGEVWPESYDVTAAVWLEFESGYGVTRATVEDGEGEPLLQALRFYAAALYEHREAVVAGVDFAELPSPVGFMSQIAPFMVH